MIKIENTDCLQELSKIESKKFDLVLTDPPYGMAFQSGYRKEKHEKIQNDDDLYWLPLFFYHIKRVLKDDSHAYVFCSHHNIDIFKKYAGKYFKVKNILVWEKNNTGMGDLKGDYAPKYEFILFLTKGKRKLNGARDSNILKFSRTSNEYHPTEKPVDLMRYLIKKSTQQGDFVFDPFIGSGSTAVACKQTKRNCLGFEINSKYVKTALKRLEDGER